MDRKHRLRGSFELLLLCILHHGIFADGDVGCRFSKNLCDSRTEVCYNDLAFGRCIPLYANLGSEDLYQYNLDGEKLNLLRQRLQRLEYRGYKWPDPYTQCIMQISLYNFRHRIKQDLLLCQNLERRDEMRYREDNDIIPENKAEPLAIVNFVPNTENSYSEFANEIYYPPGTRQESTRFASLDKEFSHLPYSDKQMKLASPIYRLRYISEPHSDYNSLTNDKSDDGNDIRNDDDNNENDYVNDINVDDSYISQMKLRKQPALKFNDIEDQYYPPVINRYNLRNYENANMEIPKNNNLLKDDEDGSRENQLRIKNIFAFLPDRRTKFYDDAIKKNADVFPVVEDEVEPYDRTFSRKYKRRQTNVEFLGGDVAWKRNSNEFNKDDNKYDDENLKQVGATLESSVDSPLSAENGMYTEGGLLQPMKQANIESTNDAEGNSYGVLFDDLEALLLTRELSGFKRRERLDVKKPGPPFLTNNYAFDAESPSTSQDIDLQDEEDPSNEVLLLPLVKKKLKSNAHKYASESDYKKVDTDHVYIEFQQNFHTWSEGAHVVNEVGRLLGLTPGTLKDVRVGRAEVTFKVIKNNKNYNATDIANNIDNIRNNLRELSGVDVIRAGIGDKVKLPATLEVPNEMEMSSTLFGAIVAAGIASATAAAVVTLVIVRRHAKSRAKLAGLTTPDPEASKDYQDLCRVRMQAKQTSEKPEKLCGTNAPFDNEANMLLSNRSSTSSWTDEPALSNMDISTGHMVLSYMEDHLKNKDRLDQEWIALCAYEVHPSSTKISENEENAKYNRPGVPLPYDHSRVVLNDLMNVNNSNYINASTITDHDPRNPTYIATQGPLPQTASDFWQLVWEQGGVVIVTLTRLTEDGHAMCHRYWPDQTEGSEIYHIYEVHLVSEHLWCDDYLVRSFYLKNLRTGETRTVTQFHFLSWPDNGVPYSTKALLEFRRKVNKSYRGRSCPIIVHCSDGAGRTGTYCLIDMVLNRIAKGAKEIDIAATLEHIRDQRPNMVTTKQQFEFVLMAVAEEVHAILKALSIPLGEKSASITGNNSSPPLKSEQ